MYLRLHLLLEVIGARRVVKDCIVGRIARVEKYMSSLVLVRVVQ